jgi:thymidylate synthase (FAD)
MSGVPETWVDAAAAAAEAYAINAAAPANDELATASANDSVTHNNAIEQKDRKVSSSPEETEDAVKDGGARRVLGGFVRLDASLADDLSVVNAARVSFGKRRQTMGQDDKGLIRFLMREKHGTPFEHNCFRFHVRCPIFVAREWFRHRIGSFNEFSMRYAKPQNDWYVPASVDVRTQVGKPGAYRYESMPSAAAAEQVRVTIDNQCRAAFATYEKLLEAGVAKELARSVLPVGFYTEFYWTLNARSLMNFVSLRSAPSAQLEIRRFSEAVEELFAHQMPETYAAFVANGRKAP